ncbi:MAG TPA: hypothetical protein VGF92_22270 [Stellaceae bacterium]
MITFGRAIHALTLASTMALAACSSEQANMAPTLGPGEVLLDKSFNVAFFVLPKKISLTILTRASQDIAAPQFCSAIFYTSFEQPLDVLRIEVQTASGTLSLDGSNAAFEPTQKGEPIDFVRPNKKAKCTQALPPPGFVSGLKTATLQVISIGDAPLTIHNATLTAAGGSVTKINVR